MQAVKKLFGIVLLLLIVTPLLLGQGCPPPASNGGDTGDEGSSGGDGDGGSDSGGDDGSGDDSSVDNSGGSSDSAWPQQARLTAFDAQGDDLYGDAVAAHDQLVIVGTEQKDSLAGVADVFIQFAGEWQFFERLTRGSARFPEQSFGSAVAISNQHAFVGAQKFAIEGSFDIQHGAVYVFRNGGSMFEQIQLLTVSDGQDFEYFGNALAYEDDQGRLIAGAFGRENSAGAAYVYAYNGSQFNLEQRLVASDGGSFDNFGSAVAMSGVYALVGAPNQDSGLGAAYVFERLATDWVDVQKITASDGVQTDRFGEAVAIDGNTLVISAPSKMRDGDELLAAGAVYVYARSGSTWSLAQKIEPSDEFAGLFGSSVAVRDGVIAIGIEGQGRVVLYKNDGSAWTMTGTILPDPDTSVSSFGNAVALTEDLLAVGARSADVDNQRASGAAFLFAPPGSNDGPDLGDDVRF